MFIKLIRAFLIISSTMLFTNSCSKFQKAGEETDQGALIVRISKIEIDIDYLDEYKAILIEEAEASVRLEDGVIAIYPMFQQNDSTQIRILEIYKDQEAYEAHLQTAHFKKYKTTTQSMVKSLNLVDMESMDAETMQAIFRKLN